MSRPWGLTCPEEVPNVDPFARAEQLRPFRLWTLRELMSTFKAGEIVDLLTRLLGGATLTLLGNASDPADPRSVAPMLKMLHDLRTQGRKHDLSVSLRLLEPLIGRLEKREPLSLSDIANLIAEVVRATIAELDTRAFVSLPSFATDYYEQAHLFGPEVTDRFPSAADDIREAGTCLALGRYTASVFHLMRVLECGLLELGKIAGVTDPKPSWESVFKGIKRALATPYPQRSPELQKHSRFLEQALPYFEAIAGAWRNKVVHFENKVVPTAEYTKEKAETILTNTRELMKLLLTQELSK
jgi:hypothetical protein